MSQLEILTIIVSILFTVALVGAWGVKKMGDAIMKPKKDFA